MKPGLELDILVAEKVMKLKVVKNKSGSKYGGFYYSIGRPYWYDDQGDMKLENPVPNYSDDIVAAWEVVEKMRRKIFRIETDSMLWTIVIHKMDKRGIKSYQAAMSDSFPHAICLAALKVIGVNV